MTLDEFHQPNGCRFFWAFGHNEGMNKKIRKHYSRNIEIKKIIKVKVIMANIDRLTALLVSNT